MRRIRGWFQNGKRLQSQKNKILFFSFFGFIFLLLFAIVFLNPSISMDEIWVYQFARRILYHQLPYRDYGMITTPLKAQMDAFILRIFSDQLYVLRLIAFITALLNVFLFYLISLHLKLSRNKTLILIFLFLFSFSQFPINNYSWLSVFWLSLVLLLLLGEKKLMQAFLIGFFTSMLLLTKQNIGIYLMIGLFFYFLKFRYRFGLYFILGFLIGLLPEVAYFYYNHALGDFLSIFYRVILTFYQERVFFHSPFSFILPTCLLVMIGYFFISFQEEKKTCLFLFAIIALGFAFPIFDIVHFLFSIPFLVLFFLYLFSIKNKIIAYCLIFFFCFRGFCWFLMVQESSLSSLNHFKMIPIENATRKNMETVVDYIKRMQSIGKHCYVIDFTNIMFDILLNRFSFKYDSMMRESLGKEGETEIINVIKNDKTAIVILLKKYSNKQQQTIITKYVRENLHPVPSFSKNYLVFTH